MSPHDAAEDVQAVIEALTEQQRVVWVFSNQYADEEIDHSYYSSPTKALRAAQEFIDDALMLKNIDIEQHTELSVQLVKTAPGLSALIDGLLYLNIYSAKVE